jgi:hypothetical protein
MDVELFKPLKLVQRTLKATGVWQDGNQSWSYYFFGHIFRFVFIEVTLLLLVLATPDCQNDQEVFKYMVVITLISMLSFMCVMFLVKIRKTQKLFANLLDLLKLSEDHRFKGRKLVKDKVALVFKVYKFYWFRSVTTTLVGLNKPVLEHKLPADSRFPFDVHTNEVGFWIASVYLALIGLIMSAISVTLDILPSIFITYATGMLEELSKRLSMIEDFTKMEMEEELLKCIKIHKKIIKYVKEIEENFSECVFVKRYASCFVVYSTSFLMSKVK